MSERPLEYVSIVAKESPLGQRLAMFTPVGLDVLCNEFIRRFSVGVEITECDDDPAPHFEITFRMAEIVQLRALYEIAFEFSPPEPEQ